MSKGPGKWQRLILERLEEAPFFALVEGVAADLARPLSASEVSALHRAARQLAAGGRCDLGLFYTDDTPGMGRRLETCLCRPGHVFKGGKTLKELSVQRVPRGTRSTFSGSLRDLAAEGQVSVAQVRRDLASLRQEGRLE